MIRYLNRSDIPIYSIFGLTLLPMAILCYQGRLSLGSISPIPLFLLLLAILFSSKIEIPIKKIRTIKSENLAGDARGLEQAYGVPVQEELKGHQRRTFDTIITLNLGGFIIPTITIAYLLFTGPVTSALEIMLIMIVATSLLAEMVNGIGITVPDHIWIIAVPFAFLLSPNNAPMIIFISSIGGILIGTIVTLIRFNKEEKGSAYINLGGVGSIKAIYTSAMVASLISYFI